jgi:hypothetical protein
MTVWVVCANDFPDAVFATAEAAVAYAQRERRQREQEYATAGIYPVRMIHYHMHEFEVRG